MISNQNKWIKDSYINPSRERYFYPSVQNQEEKLRILYNIRYGDLEFLDYIDLRHTVCTRKGDINNFKYWTFAHIFHGEGDIDVNGLCCPLCRHLTGDPRVPDRKELESAIRKSYTSTVNLINSNYIVDIDSHGMSLQTILNNAL